MEVVMRTTFKAVSVTVALIICLVAGSAAGATTTEVGHFSGEDHFAPQVITDLPCLEGKEFVATGSVVFRGTFVNSEGFFHFTGIQRFSGTLVPVDGQGPTYVESGNVDKVNFTAHDVSAGVQLIQTRVNNDRFLGYVDGKVVASTTIRIHEVEHFVGLDTNDDGVPDIFKVSVNNHDFSCPA
jgi:hypothetical protein